MKYRKYLFSLAPILFLSSFDFGQQKAKASICPVVGSATECRSLVTLTDSYYGTTLSSGEYYSASYDNSNDFIFGITNNSSKSVTSIELGGYYPVSQNSVAYNSSNVSLISPYNTAGATIDFNAPLATGDSAYFSLSSKYSSTPCSSAVNNSVSKSVLSNGTEMSATFTPSSGVTTQEAASLCGFKTFNWQQTVTYDPVNVARSNIAPNTPLIAPYSDPPPGGYTYDNSPIGDSYPYYYSLLINPLNLNDTRSLSNYISSNRLLFSDQPFYPNFQSGQYFGFTTQLVGVLPDDTLKSLGINFSWTSNYTGTSGGIIPPTPQNLSLSLDSGNGTGSVTITRVSASQKV